MKKIFAGIAVIITALGIGPLAAEMLKNWMANNGYLEHPEVGAAWVVTTVAALADQPWFVTATLMIAAIGLLLFATLWFRRWKENRRQKRLTLAAEMTDLATAIRRRQGGFRSDWPENVGDIRPYIDSILIKARHAGLYSPPDKIFDRGDGARLLAEHLQFVGIYISEGHWDVAKKRALQLKDSFD